ncbi:TPA: hypothetical protein ACIPUI_000240 [Citrobacter freundii]
MKQVYLFNTGSEKFSFSINNGPYLRFGSTSASIKWEPVPWSEDIIFINQCPPPQGKFGWGPNTLTLYPEGFASHAVNFGIDLPKTININSVQLYFFCEKEATRCALTVCINGQFYRLLYPQQK